MPRSPHSCRPALGLLAAFSGLLLASCQTSADEVLSLGDAASSEEVSTTTGGRTAFRDPYVVANSGQSPTATVSASSQTETDPPRLKRQPVPMAAAFADIAEPPPEVLALQQQAAQGQLQTAGAAQMPANRGEITLQPTAVNAGSNSLFSAARGQPQSAAPAHEPTTAQMAAAGALASPSLVPGDMPTLGVNAVRKSLFSPSAEQQALMQQQALEVQSAAVAPDGLPLSEPVAASGEEEPALRKLSDPRPKRKILALREPASAVPERVQLTPDQLQAMGAVQEFDPAEPLPADEQTVATAEAGGKKKSWLPSLSNLLKGGNKTEKAATSP